MKTRFIDEILNLKDKCVKKEEKIVNIFSISPSEYRALLTIEPGEILMINTYSKRMELSVSRGGRVIEKLVKTGYLEHMDCAGDRRCNMVSLTASGKKIREQIDIILDECEEDLFSKIPETELNNIRNTIKKLTNIINA